MQINNELVEFSDEIREIEKKLKEKGHNLFNLERILESWQQTLRFFREPYIGTMDEYVNDLSYRDALERFTSHATHALKTAIMKRVKPIDDEFLSLTEEWDSNRHEPKEHFWIHRRPRQVNENFKDEFGF